MGEKEEGKRWWEAEGGMRRPVVEEDGQGQVRVSGEKVHRLPAARASSGSASGSNGSSCALILPPVTNRRQQARRIV